jgi:hypothetical protein
MSGWILIAFVDFRVFLVDLDRVCCGSFGLFLVRNWCGSRRRQIFFYAFPDNRVTVALLACVP